MVESVKDGSTFVQDITIGLFTLFLPYTLDPKQFIRPVFPRWIKVIILLYEGRHICILVSPLLEKAWVCKSMIYLLALSGRLTI